MKATFNGFISSMDVFSIGSSLLSTSKMVEDLTAARSSDVYEETFEDSTTKGSNGSFSGLHYRLKQPFFIIRGCNIPSLQQAATKG